MKFINRNYYIEFAFVSILLIGGVLVGHSYFAQASNLKTIVVTFNTAPTFANVIKTPLKYNKNFAFSFSLDDGGLNGY